MSAHLVAAIGWALLHFVWEGALIGCAAGILLTALRNARPETRYALACAALLLCLAWPLADLVLMLGSHEDRGAPSRTLAGLAGAVLRAGPSGLLGWMDSHLGAIVGAWAACAGALGLRMALGLLWVGRAARAQAGDREWQARLSSLAQRCGLTRELRLRVVEGLASPVTAGCWRPVVLVPASLLTGMDALLLEALLTHELGHVKRHDYLVNLVQNVIEALLFYHPAVWWLSKRIRLEREQIADDFAARQLGEPRRLALALSELERMQFADARSGQRLAQAANGGDLVGRIRRLLRPSAQALGWQAAIPVLGLALACAAQAHVAMPQAASAARAPVRLTHSALVDFDTCVKPMYPHDELRAGHQGTVTLAYMVDREGVVRQARVRKSSGYPRLDEAARGAIARCSFKPATVDGKPVEKLTLVQYVWTLQ
jgi:D-alanyl-D-alanine endopeptidase (penicillin-binding protein 7)